MKLVKAASGKETIKLSKSDWLSIGKRAGWIKEAEVAKDVYDEIVENAKENSVESETRFRDVEFETFVTKRAVQETQANIGEAVSIEQILEDTNTGLLNMEELMFKFGLPSGGDNVYEIVNLVFRVIEETDSGYKIAGGFEVHYGYIEPTEPDWDAMPGGYHYEREK